jgi:hypothetical protein
MIVTAPINNRAGSKFALLASQPIMIGIPMDAGLPRKLNTPLVTLIRSFGAKVETNTQVIVAKPFPKKRWP